MGRLVEKKEIVADQLNNYIATTLKGWKKTRQCDISKDCIFETEKGTCFIYAWNKGYLIQRIEG